MFKTSIKHSVQKVYSICCFCKKVPSKIGYYLFVLFLQFLLEKYIKIFKQMLKLVTYL